MKFGSVWVDIIGPAYPVAEALGMLYRKVYESGITLDAQEQAAYERAFKIVTQQLHSPHGEPPEPTEIEPKGEG